MFEQVHMIVPVDVDFAQIGEWQNPEGEIVGFDGEVPIVSYYGNCPCCKATVLADTVRGTYADPVYPSYCSECGTKVK